MSWYQYEDAREQKAEIRRKLDSRRKRGEKFEALSVPQGSRKLAQTFWGKAWCDHLESHRDYEYRLPRGRSYLRQGNVYNLCIERGVVTASVAGSSLYEVSVTIQPLAKDAWKRIKEDCAGKVASLLDLLSGKLGDGVLRAVTDAERGLFPRPKEIRLSCTCPDDANMCKHVAAVLYGVGVKLDTDPDLFFVLRSVDPSELLSGAAQETLGTAQGSDAALDGEDLGALFGIELGAAAAEPEKTPARKPVKKVSAGKLPAGEPSAEKSKAGKTPRARPKSSRPSPSKATKLKSKSSESKKKPAKAKRGR